MPVNFVSETTKGIEKSKFSLSLNKNNATYLSKENRKPDRLSVTNSSVISNKNCKENKPAKRPFQSTYLNTLSVAKKLKPLVDNPKRSEYSSDFELVVEKSASNAAMLNGHHPPDNQYAGGAQKKTPVASLSNLGNTCFLNSVLYTLRYAPRFLHNLHHLVSDLASVDQKLGSIRLKSSSLGRSAAGLASSGTRSWSSKDLLSLGQSENNSGKSKIQIATEKLHETYLNLRLAESKCITSNETSPEPYAADAFLAALRDVNSTFEGNRQQDAHELLLCILDNIRETCRALSTKAARLQVHETDSNGLSRQPSLDGDGTKSSLASLRKPWKKRKDTPSPASDDNEENNTGSNESERENTMGWDFVGHDFEGTMVVRLTCLECECVSEKAQAVCELCVPVGESETEAGADADACGPFRAACLASECLTGKDKYWCEKCLRYNEARRTVSYSRLPRLLVLQLKRFSGGMEKITRHTPTPMHMPCFCEPCLKATKKGAKHKYMLWAVIMHLGSSLTGGHYVAYALAAPGDDKSAPAPSAGDACQRRPLPAQANPQSFIRGLFNRPRPQPTGCSVKDCCIPRQKSEECWLACDDELVKPITNEEFQDLLSAEPKMRSAATPYLLFYVKSENG